MSPEEESHFYQAEYAKIYSAEKGTDISHLSYARMADAEMYFNWVEKSVLPGRMCMEAGCASGYFLELMRDKGYYVSGIEPHTELRNMCERSGIRMFPSIESCGTESCDYLFMFFLLEHLGDPVKFLGHAKRVCRTGGKIFIVVPNVDDVLLSTYDMQSFRDFYFTPAHQFYYSRGTLSLLLRKSFLPCHYILPKQRYDLSNHMHWMMAGKPGGMGKYIHETGSFTSQCYQENLCDRFLCDTLLAIVEVG